MSIIGWLVLGLISGFIASKIVNKHGEGVVLDIVLGIVGALIGGWLFAQFGGQGIFKRAHPAVVTWKWQMVERAVRVPCSAGESGRIPELKS